MKLVQVYLRIYGICVREAFSAISKNVWTLILPMLLVETFLLMAQFLGRTGFLGGILLAFARSAAFSVYTYFVAELVSRRRVSLSEFSSSIGAYIWNYVNLFFVLWIVDLLIATLAAGNRNQPAIMGVVTVMELVVFNAAPEVIYVKRSYGGLETIRRSFVFLQENWIEWFIPNGLALAVVYFGIIDSRFDFLRHIPMRTLVLTLVGGAALHVLMIFRGFLFELLEKSSHRQRMFRYHSAG